MVKEIWWQKQQDGLRLSDEHVTPLCQFEWVIWGNSK